MKNKGLAYIFLIVSVLIILLILVIKEEYDSNKTNTNVVTVEHVEGTCLGSKILEIYKNNPEPIEQGLIKISIRDRYDQEIQYNSYDELEKLVYSLATYTTDEYTNNGVDYHIFRIESYTNLITQIERSKVYDKQKFEIYYGDEYDMDAKPTTVRDLKENELYGTDVINNFVGHEADIVSGKIYFNIIDGTNKTKYTSYSKIKNEINKYDIYKKSFELSGSGQLLGYSFTKVK